MNTPAKKIPSKQAPARTKPKAKTATVTGADEAIVALVRHMAKDHRLTHAEVRMKMGMDNNPKFDGYWKAAGL